jgi:hypothetical protein
VKGFSSVGGGVKGRSAKLEGGVACCLCTPEAWDIDIAFRCATLRSRTVVVAKTDRGLDAGHHS